MKILVLGKGKTGAIVAEIGQQRGHEVTTLSGAENQNASALTKERLAGTDVVIDFTTPAAVVENIKACARARINVVVGTTGWLSNLDEVRRVIEQNGIGLVYGSNFSVGIHVFFEVAKAASAGMALGYGTKIVERHHTQKKDAPSGTAASLQKIMTEAGGAQPEITSIREGDTVGTHVILLDSENDVMMLVHDAKSRRGFAEGAVRAAEWIKGKRGFFEFKDIYRELP